MINVLKSLYVLWIYSRGSLLVENNFVAREPKNLVGQFEAPIPKPH